jgi:hypothetical protein
MNVIQLNWKLKETFGKEIPIALMFRNLSIRFIDRYLLEGEQEDGSENLTKQMEIIDNAQETLKDTIGKLTGI